MLVRPEEFRELWEAVKNDTHNSEHKTISIFVSTQDCDSVCTVRALQVGLTLRCSSCNPYTKQAHSDTQAVAGHM